MVKASDIFSDSLDGEYNVLSSEEVNKEDEDEEDDGDSDGRAALALDTPEPAMALAAAEGGIGKGKGAVDLKGRKGKKGLKSAGAGLDITLDEKAFGLEESVDAEAAAEKEETELSAYDLDEITDIDAEDVDPLAMLLGITEKPWENEQLSPAEQGELDRVMRLNDPETAPENGQDAHEQKQPGARKQNTKQNTSHENTRVTGMIAAAAMGALATKAAIANTHTDHKQDGQKQSSHQKATQESVQEKYVATRKTIEKSRQNAEDVTMQRVDNGLAYAMGIGTMIGMPTAAAILYGSRNGASPTQQQNNLAMLHMATLNQAHNLSWSPETQTSNFAQALNTIYAALGSSTLMNVSMYRRAGWDEKREEHRQNAQDITIALAAPEPKTPTPDFDLNREMRPQMNIGGPSGV